MKNNLKITGTIALALMLGGMVITGCSSDSVAPHDDTPQLTQENAAYQAAMGGADGEPSTPSLADYAHLYTLSGEVLLLTYPGYPAGAMSLTVNLMADLDQDNDTATILAGSGGTFVVGIYTGTYAIDGFAVGGSGYPSAGTLTFTGGGHTLIVTFNGTNSVPVSADGATVGTLNLDDGTYTPVN